MSQNPGADNKFHFASFFLSETKSDPSLYCEVIHNLFYAKLPRHNEAEEWAWIIGSQMCLLVSMLSALLMFECKFENSGRPSSQRPENNGFEASQKKSHHWELKRIFLMPYWGLFIWTSPQIVPGWGWFFIAFLKVIANLRFFFGSKKHSNNLCETFELSKWHMLEKIETSEKLKEVENQKVRENEANCYWF